METAARRKYTWFGVVFALALAADQLTKVWARRSLKDTVGVDVIKGWFELHYSENPYAAFGLGRIFGTENARWVLLAVGIVACFVLFRLVRKAKPEQTRVLVEIGLVAGGAIGNLFDRIVRARVTDFVVWRYKEYQWPTFNLADAFLVVGVVALLFDMKGEQEAAPVEKPARPSRRKR